MNNFDHMDKDMTHIHIIIILKTTLSWKYTLKINKNIKNNLQLCISQFYEI